VTTQEQFSPETIRKAELLLGRKNSAGVPIVLRDEQLPSIWWVENSAGTSRYRVQTDWSPQTLTLTWINCSCPHGANKGGGQCRCYHAAAVLMLLRDEKLAHEHEPMEGVGRIERCVCGWPTDADRAEHTSGWRPRFAEHLLDERRKLAG
jgi:hypothetical protein